MRTKLVWYFETVPVEELEVVLGDARRIFCPPGESASHPSAIRLWRENGVTWVTTDGVDQPLCSGVTVLTEWRPELQRIETPREAGVRAVWNELRWPLAGIPITAALALCVGLAIPAPGAPEPQTQLTSHVVEMSPEEYKRLTEALRKRPVIVPAKPENVAKAKVVAGRVAKAPQTPADPKPGRAPPPKERRVASLGGEAAPLQAQSRAQQTDVSPNSAAAITQLGADASAGLPTSTRGGLSVVGGGERGERGGAEGRGRAGFGGGSGEEGGGGKGFGSQTGRPHEKSATEREAMAKVCSVGARSTITGQIELGGARYSATTVRQWCRTSLPKGLTWAGLLAALKHTA